MPARRYIVEMLPIRRKTQSNQSSNIIPASSIYLQIKSNKLKFNMYWSCFIDLRFWKYENMKWPKYTRRGQQKTENTTISLLSCTLGKYLHIFIHCNNGLIYSKIILHVDNTYPGTFSQPICHEPNIQHMARRAHRQMSNSYFPLLFRIPHHIRKPWLHQSHPCRSPTRDL